MVNARGIPGLNRPRPLSPRTARRYNVPMRATMPLKEVDEFFARLSAADPEPEGELNYVNEFTLTVAVVLSAQATDAGVNKATEKLFKIADTPEKMLALGEAKVRGLHQDHRAVSQQGEECDRPVRNADRRFRR